MSVVPSAAGLRPARADHADSHFIYHLSMDPSVLAMSTRGQLFSFQEHSEWYARRVQDSLIYIIEADGQPAGYVRWGLAGAGEWEVSIAVAPEHRRKGYARQALLASHPADTTAVALVLMGNDASCRLFESCGYVRVGTEERMGKQHWRYERRAS